MRTLRAAVLAVGCLVAPLGAEAASFTYGSASMNIDWSVVGGNSSAIRTTGSNKFETSISLEDTRNGSRVYRSASSYDTGSFKVTNVSRGDVALRFSVSSNAFAESLIYGTEKGYAYGHVSSYAYLTGTTDTRSLFGPNFYGSYAFAQEERYCSDSDRLSPRFNCGLGYDDTQDTDSASSGRLALILGAGETTSFSFYGGSYAFIQKIPLDQLSPVPVPASGLLLGGGLGILGLVRKLRRRAATA